MGLFKELMNAVENRLYGTGQPLQPRKTTAYR